MEKLLTYNLTDEIESISDEITLHLAEDDQGNEFEMLVIQPINSQKSFIKRIIDNEIRPLIDCNYGGIQKVIACGFEKEKNIFFIVYESLEDKGSINKSKYRLEQCVQILDNLKKDNREGFLLNDYTVVLYDDNIKYRYIGLFDLFIKYDVTWAKGTEKRKRVKDDIKSLANLFKDYLSDTEEKQEIYNRCIDGVYKKYRELLVEVTNISEVENPEWEVIRVVTQQENYDGFTPILDEMNEHCYWKIENELSEKDQVTGQFTTKHYSGRFFVDVERGYLFIPFPKNEKPNEWIERNGELAKYNFSFDDGDSSNIAYFEEKFDEINEIATLHESKHEALTKWKTLPEKEKEYIEEKAFKAEFIQRESSKSNELNIKFTLIDKFNDWETIKNKKNDDVMLSINEDDVGKILDYKPKNKLIIIKDSKLSLDEIPRKGELVEEVREQTSQYKKQIEACQKFETQDMVNPDLAGFLATPEEMPSLNRVSIDYEELAKNIFDNKLKDDETQTQAVLDALHKKPVYLIQGPPGTGKTTVIIELIRQLVHSNQAIKILIVSQSNLAVDNVLERLPEDILFMRLASDKAAKSDHITKVIKEHLFDNKLQNWIEETKQRSKSYFDEKYPDQSKNPALENLYNTYQTIPKNINNIVDVFRKKYNQGFYASYFSKLFDKVKTTTDIQTIFHQELGKKHLKIKQLQTDWFSFLQNATSEQGEKKLSMLNNGSQEIDLKTAFAMSVNVIGATCIHIASARYSKINFRFDYMIMDESSKATAAEALVPITMSKNLVLIGDHKQLPPVVTREEVVKKKIREQLDDNGLDFDKEYGESHFEYLITRYERSNQLASYKIMLDIQYRMPRQIGYLISKYIYDGELINPDINKMPNYDKDKNHGLKLRVAEINTEKGIYPNSIIFVSTSKQNNPYDNDDKYNRQNACNIEIIKNTLLKLNQLYQDDTKSLNIGIIAGYRGQVNLLKDKISLNNYKAFVNNGEVHIEINTVDKFQGAERDIIIYDIVRSSRGTSPIGFLDDYRRINVAFSRAKRLLIIVGDSEYILKRAILNPGSKFSELKLKLMIEQLAQWQCIYDSLEDALQ